MGTRLVVPVSIALVLPIATSAPRPKDERVLYYPTTVGEERLLGFDGKEGPPIAPLRILGVTENRGVTTVEVASVLKGGRLTGKFTVEVTDKGVCLIQNDKGALETPIWLLKLPIKPGNKWEVTLYSPDGKPEQAIRKAEIEEEVLTPVGKFKAVRVEVEKPEGTLWITEWWAPGQGKVKHSASPEPVVLKSITPGKK